MTNSVDSSVKTQLSGLRPGVQDAIIAYVRRVVTCCNDEVLSITLYGSQARGEAGPESDIDLFVVTRNDRPALRQTLIDLAWEVQFEHNVVISDIIYTASQLKRIQASHSPYYQNLEKEGILLWQNMSEPTPVFD